MSRRTKAMAIGACLAAAASALADEAPVAPAPQRDLRDAVEQAIGASVHGTITNRYRLRSTIEGTDQDMFQTADLRFGDESKDRVSGALFVRSFEDLDRAHENQHGFVFRSIDDTFGRSVNALLYTAYVNVRPTSGPLETARVGRQYVYAADTFHVDGASATTRPLVDKINLTVTGYGGVPVHFYEAQSSGDWLAGVRVAADPWKGGRTALDYTHDQDRFALFSSEEKNDLAAFSAWQKVGEHVDVFGQFEWLDGPRDATLRATAAFPDEDLLVQARVYRLLEKQKQFATEFDPFSRVLQDLARYEQAELSASKGLGGGFDVEAGVQERRLLPGEDETPFNRDSRRTYVTPSVSDLFAEGNTVSLTAEQLTGGSGERVRTWAADVTQKIGKKTKISVGSDYTLYGYGPLASDEREHVRTAYVRAKFAITKALSADVRYSWERNDVETFHVLTLALVLDF